MVFVLASSGQAQLVPGDELDGVPNYSYAVFTGTGFYTLNDRRLMVLRLPFSWRIRDTEPETGHFGIKLMLPMALGITNFEKISDIPELNVDSLATFSFVPGIMFEIPVTATWALKPFAQAGMGWDLKSSYKNNTVIWGGGLQTRYQPWIDSSRWKFGGEILAAGNNPRIDAPNTRFNRLGLGLEYRHPLPGSVLNRKISIHTQLIGYKYLNDVDFLPPVELIKLDRSIALGVSVGIEPAIKFLGASIDQLGLGYKVGNELRAIELIFSFPF